MKIQYDAEQRFFHLQAGEMSYAFGIAPDGRLLNLYWGPVLETPQALSPLVEEVLRPFQSSGGVDQNTPLNFEVPTREPWDYSDPVLWVRHPDGNRGLRLLYHSHEIVNNQLNLILRDEHYPVEVELHYRGWGDLPLLTRWLTVRHSGNQPLQLQAVKSAAWHVPAGLDYRLTHLSGNWGCEYTRNQLMLTQARTVLQNTRVTSSAAQQTPFFALDQDGAATEKAGEVYFGMLHWGGDFNITIEQQFGKRVSVTGGVNEFDSDYVLQPGESFETPEFTGGFSTRGFEHMSEILYDWQLDALMPRGQKSDKAHATRPVIYNSWYPYEFSVDEENCLALIDKCAPLGVELFVIDDGWMPKRINDRAGLGDWVADPARFPHGMSAVADACHAKGMLFGLWVEPEMVNPDSELYRAHPDWIIQIPTRKPSLQRHQLVLNLARDEIRDWIIDWLDQLIRDFHLDYLKWDMNRYVSENGWPDAAIEDQPSLSIRYTQNLMSIWKHLNEAFPDVLFENCAAGGGRTNFAMVPYADRINRSDNADPVDLMVLHEGFSMLFVPKTAGGAGNIAPAAHHIHQRPTPLDFRVHWGMTGSMSIGINLLTASEQELTTLQGAITEFKRLRGDLQDAYVYRIASATKNPYALFQYVRRDRGAFTLFAFAHGMRCWNLPMPRFRMRGLDPKAVYCCEDGRSMTGEALMNIGLSLRLKGDCDSVMSVWRRQE
ncbi:MAG: alpha-galactosidase [Eubacteriales bacterium]|nr:alpha-galactosidase [Eubacteriales bacterium]